MAKLALVFAPYGSWEVHHQFDAVVGLALKVRGWEVGAILCDGVIANCMNAGRPFNQASCINCGLRGVGLFNSLGIQGIQLRAAIGDADVQEVLQWVEKFPLENFADAQFDGLPIGEWVRIQVNAYFLTDEPDFQSEEVRNFQRGLLYSGAVLSRALNRIFDQTKPNHLICFNSSNAYYRVAYELALLKGIPVTVHERGTMDGNFTVLQGMNVNQFSRRLPLWNSWANVPLTREECEWTLDYFRKREKCTPAGVPLYYSQQSDPIQARRVLNLPNDARLVGLFTSSSWETSILTNYEPLIFDSQFAWIEAAAKECAKRGLYLIVRHHPSLYQKDYGDNSFILRAFRQAQRMPENVRVLMPYEEFTSYALLWNLEAAIISYSTIGAEALLRGVGVASIANSLYEPMGIESAKSADTFGAAIDRAIAKTNNFSKEDLRAAYRYAHYFYRTANPAPRVVSIKNGGEVGIAVQRIEDVASGADPELDRICNSIMNGESLIPPAPCGRDSREEDEFIETQLASLREKRSLLKSAVDLQSEPKRSGEQATRIVLTDEPLPKIEISKAIDRNTSIRAPGMTILKASYTPDERGRGIVDVVRRAIEASPSDFLWIGPTGVEQDESVVPLSIDRMTDEGVDCVVWGAWVVSKDGSITGEIHSKRNPTFEANGQPLGGARERMLLNTLSLAFWRKVPLKRLLSSMADTEGNLLNNWYEQVVQVYSGNDPKFLVKRISAPAVILSES